MSYFPPTQLLFLFSAARTYRHLHLHLQSNNQPINKQPTSLNTSILYHDCPPLRPAWCCSVSGHKSCSLGTRNLEASEKCQQCKDFIDGVSWIFFEETNGKDRLQSRLEKHQKKVYKFGRRPNLRSVFFFDTKKKYKNEKPLPMGHPAFSGITYPLLCTDDCL